MAKALHVPLDSSISNISDIPYTISYVIRKRQQIDSFMELPKDKRPPEHLVWSGTQDEIEQWLDDVYFNRNNKIEISLADVEG